MQQQIRKDYIDSGFHAVGYFIGAVVFGTAAATWWTIKKSGQLTRSAGRACKARSTVLQKPENAAVQHPVFAARAMDLGSSTLQEKVLEDGSVLRIFFYPKAGIARRRLIKDGARVQMDDLSYSDKAQAVEQTLTELKQGNKPVLGASKTAPVVQNNPMPSEKLEIRPKQEAHVEMRPPKKEVSYRGVMTQCGVEKREDVSNPYDCYCIHLADQLLGVVNKLWGTDLQRAVQQAGVEPGDTVEVSVVGETPVFSGGKAKTKKVWSIVKLK